MKTDRKASVKSDIYSLGCSMYEVMTGKVPFPTNNPQLLIKMKIENNYSKINVENYDYPQQLIDLLYRMMDKVL
jgi:serine/threonine protein kinase